MRLLAIGDIHGCTRALEAFERFVPVTPDDRLVTLGDYVDRGPDSRGVMEWLLARRAEGRLVSLRGNHELMMLAARHSPRHFDEWLACGGGAALASYAEPHAQGRLGDVPTAHWRFMERGCRAYFATATHFFVHANALPDVALADQPDYMLYWEPFHDPPPHESGKIMVCGHTPQRNGVPRNIGHAVCIDTHAHAGGWLTCLDVASGQYWQANEAGQTRAARLDAP